MLFRLLVIAAVLAAGASSAQAQSAADTLPPELTGTVALKGSYGNELLSVPISLTVTARSGHVFAGTVSYGGSDCTTNSSAVEGTFDGSRLVFTAQLPQCGKSMFELSQVGAHEFEGQVIFEHEPELGRGSSLTRIVHLEE